MKSFFCESASSVDLLPEMYRRALKFQKVLVWSEKMYKVIIVEYVILRG
jgi:hypothetical protein